MKTKYRERLKIMNHVNQQLRKRKAFLENLLIRIKEKQLTSYDEDVDLVVRCDTAAIILKLVLTFCFILGLLHRGRFMG